MKCLLTYGETRQGLAAGPSEFSHLCRALTGPKMPRSALEFKLSCCGKPSESAGISAACLWFSRSLLREA